MHRNIGYLRYQPNVERGPQDVGVDEVVDEAVVDAPADATGVHGAPRGILKLLRTTRLHSDMTTQLHGYIVKPKSQ